MECNTTMNEHYIEVRDWKDGACKCGAITYRWIDGRYIWVNHNGEGSLTATFVTHQTVT